MKQPRKSNGNDEAPSTIRGALATASAAGTRASAAIDTRGNPSLGRQQLMRVAEITLTEAVGMLRQLEEICPDRSRQEAALARLQIQAWGVVVRAQLRSCVLGDTVNPAEGFNSMPSQLLGVVQKIEAVFLGLTPMHAMVLLELRTFAHLLRLFATTERRYRGASLVESAGMATTRTSQGPRHAAVGAVRGSGDSGPGAAVVLCCAEAERLAARLRCGYDDVLHPRVGPRGANGGDRMDVDGADDGNETTAFMRSVIDGVQEARSVGADGADCAVCEPRMTKVMDDLMSAALRYFPANLVPSPHIDARRAEILSVCGGARPGAGFALAPTLLVKLFCIDSSMRNLRLRVVFRDGVNATEVLLRPLGVKIADISAGCTIVSTSVRVPVPIGLSDPSAEIDVVLLAAASHIDAVVGGARFHSHPAIERLPYRFHSISRKVPM